MKKYLAILNQSGTSAPSVSVLENSIGEIAWSRSASGQYLGTLSGAFPAGRTVATIGDGDGGVSATIVSLNRSNDSNLAIRTKDFDLSNPSCEFADDLLVETAIDITVYDE